MEPSSAGRFTASALFHIVIQCRIRRFFGFRVGTSLKRLSKKIELTGHLNLQIAEDGEMFTSLVHKNAQVFTQKLPFGISFHESLHVPSSKTAFSTDEFTKVMSGQKRQKSNQIMYAYIYIYIYVLCIWTYISIK